MTHNDRCDVARAIRKLVLEWGEHPYQINSGHCGEFAHQLAERLAANVPTLEILEYCGASSLFGEPVEDFGTHFWVRVEEIHFDAEAPFGCTEWWHLPFFQREMISKGRGANPTHYERESIVVHSLLDFAP